MTFSDQNTSIGFQMALNVHIYICICIYVYPLLFALEILRPTSSQSQAPPGSTAQTVMAPGELTGLDPKMNRMDDQGGQA